MRKNLVYDFKPIVSGDMSLPSIDGSISDVSQYDTVTYEFIWAGGNTTNGSVSLRYSKDGINFYPLDFGSVIPADGATGNHQLIVTEIGFRYLQPVYTRLDVGATGSINCSIFQTNKGA